MLVFISDLHLGDGTAGKLNLGASAFEHLFNDLRRHARNARAERIDLVLLGDVFDLLHSAAWGETSGTSDTRQALSAAARVLEATLDENSGVFSLFAPTSLRQSLRCVSDDTPGRTLRVHYIPGNHDRLCNLDRGLREQVIGALGLWHRDADKPFPWSLYFPRYGAIARHGHEFDRWNYAGGQDLTPQAHEAAPVGDVLVTHFAARLHCELMRALTGKYVGDQEVAAFSRNLSSMYDVRPRTALVPWLAHGVASLRGNKEALRDVQRCVARVVDDVLCTGQMRRWLRRHPLSASLARPVSVALKHIDFFGLHLDRLLIPLLWSATEQGKAGKADPHVTAAMREWRYLKPEWQRDWRCVVYGHTHTPTRIPVGVRLCGRTPRDVIYVNTGTFRPLYSQTEDGRGFVGLKQMTYVILYGPDEARPKRSPKQWAEVWTGNLQDEDVCAVEPSGSAAVQGQVPRDAEPREVK